MPTNEEVPLDCITMAKDGTLLVNEKSILEQLKATKGVNVVDGRVFTCARFGNQVQHADICDNKDIKGLRADAFVLCSSYFLLAQLNELRNSMPLIRAPTELLLRTNGDYS